MKFNIEITPTNKKSEIAFLDSNILVNINKLEKKYSENLLNAKYQHIYLVQKDIEINDNDWFIQLNLNKVFQSGGIFGGGEYSDDDTSIKIKDCFMGSYSKKHCAKILYTTDKLLGLKLINNYIIDIIIESYNNNESVINFDIVKDELIGSPIIYSELKVKQIIRDIFRDIDTQTPYWESHANDWINENL